MPIRNLFRPPDAEIANIPFDPESKTFTHKDYCPESINCAEWVIDGIKIQGRLDVVNNCIPHIREDLLSVIMDDGAPELLKETEEYIDQSSITSPELLVAVHRVVNSLSCLPYNEKQELLKNFTPF